MMNRMGSLCPRILVKTGLFFTNFRQVEQVDLPKP